MTPDNKAAFKLLEKLAFVRTAGSKEELRAANILLEKAKKQGVNVKLEPFKVKDGAVTTARLEILEPYKKEYVITGYKCCKSTSKKGLEAEIVYAENLTDVNLSNVSGKIILFNGFLRLPAFKKIIKSGAAAIISMTGTMLDKEDNSDLFTRKFRETQLAFGNLPGANIRISDAFEIIEKGATKARLTVVGEETEITSHNVVATIKGTQKPEEIISFGAHFDSTEFSTGVYDNGAGSVIIMELLKHFAKNPPNRTLEFCWYGSEEIGLEGSKAYVKKHQAELEKHIFMVNVDVGGPVLGFNTCNVTASKELTAFTDMYFKAKGYAVEVKQGIYSSDSVPFADNGVPAINFSRDGAPGATFIHTRGDVMKYLSAEGLGKLIDPVFDFAQIIVNATVFPEKREVPEEMKTEIDKYLFKKELEEVKGGKS